MTENLDLEIFQKVLHLLKSEVQRHQTMLKLVHSLARERAKRTGMRMTIAAAKNGFFEFIPWNIEFIPSSCSHLNGRKGTRHIAWQDWHILENHLRDIEALLNRISVIKPTQSQP